MAHRLFVAIDVGGPVMAAVAASVDRARPLADEARWADCRVGHLTLAFLGAVPADEVAAVARAVADVAARHRPFTLALEGSGTFGGSRRPRVVWAGVGGDLPALRAAHADLMTALGAAGVALETRPFHPHLTLARARSPRGAPGLAAAADALGGERYGDWDVADLVLYESHLGTRGARHEVRVRQPLRGR
ncbi:MAG: RNA 2',3'-cyclic phosphodiesterase [Vicinamibacterales bacterium]